MRRFKSKSLLVAVVVSLTAFAVPAAASAGVWTSEGKELKVAEPIWLNEGKVLSGEQPISLKGPIKLQGEIGTIECTLQASGSLAAKDGGSITSASISGCKTGELMSHCAVTKATANSLPWKLQAIEKSGVPLVKIEGISYSVNTTGFLCPPEYKVSGTVTGAPDDAYIMSSVALSGSLASNYGPNKTSGSLSVSPGKTFGIQIITARPVSLKGSLNFTAGEVGGVTCKVLAFGEISNSPISGSGQISPFGLVKGSCVPYGLFGADCTGGVEASASGPWGLSVVSGSPATLSLGSGWLDFVGQNCKSGKMGISISGEFTGIKADNSAAMTKWIFSGKQPNLKSGAGAVSVNGELEVSPAGLYGFE